MLQRGNLDGWVIAGLYVSKASEAPTLSAMWWNILLSSRPNRRSGASAGVAATATALRRPTLTPRGSLATRN